MAQGQVIIGKGKSPRSSIDPDFDILASDWSTYKPGVKDFKTHQIPYPQYAYPSKLIDSMESEPFIHMAIVDSVASVPMSQFALGLPFPTECKVRYQSNWEDVNLGVLVNSALTGASHVDWNNLMSAIPSLSDVVKAVGGELIYGGQAGNILGTSATAGVLKGMGRMINNHAALLFSGMIFREFQLNWQLLPKNEKDSQNLNDIIFQLKYAMHPEGSGATNDLSMSLKWPNNFILGFYGPSLSWLFRTSPCALIGLEVDYAGAGIPAFFKDNSPAVINLSLHFKEMEILTKQRITQGW